MYLLQEESIRRLYQQRLAKNLSEYLRALTINKEWANIKMALNTFTAIVDLSRFNNSCLKSPASTLVDLTFQSRAPLFQLKSAT